jgi:hypothetical protein
VCLTCNFKVNGASDSSHSKMIKPVLPALLDINMHATCSKDFDQKTRIIKMISVQIHLSNLSPIAHSKYALLLFGITQSVQLSRHSDKLKSPTYHYHRRILFIRKLIIEENVA